MVDTVTGKSSNSGPKATDKAAPGESGKTLPGTDIPYSTIRVIVITTCVVFAIVWVPFLFIVKNFVTFDSVDRYFGLTHDISPKILSQIPEELEAGYSRHFAITDSRDADRMLIFTSEPQQRVEVIVDVQPFRDSTVQQINLQLNGHCMVPKPFIHDEYDLSDDLTRCPPSNGLKLNTLAIVLQKPPQRDGRLDVNIVVLVYERIHRHMD